MAKRGKGGNSYYWWRFGSLRLAKRLGKIRSSVDRRNFKGAEEPYPVVARDRTPALVRCLRSLGGVRDLLLHVRLSQAVRGSKIRGAGVLPVSYTHLTLPTKA